MLGVGCGGETDGGWKEEQVAGWAKAKLVLVMPPSLKY